MTLPLLIFAAGLIGFIVDDENWAARKLEARQHAAKLFQPALGQFPRPRRFVGVAPRIPLV